jgi:hypothetical protein
MAGMKRHDFDLIWRVKESEASVVCSESLEEIEAHFLIDLSFTSELFGTPDIQERLVSRDATDARCDALDTLTTEYL